MDLLLEPLLELLLELLLVLLLLLLLYVRYILVGALRAAYLKGG